MKKDLEKFFKQFLEENQIPFMEMIQKSPNSLHIKVYFPKIAINICKLFDNKFILKNKEQINLEKDNNGYYKTSLILIYKEQEMDITIYSMLKHTWGIASTGKL